MLERPKLKKIFLLIISYQGSKCRNEQHELLKSEDKIANFFYYYFIGDPVLEKDYIVDEINKIVYLKVRDNYESLSMKVYLAFKFIYENFNGKIYGVFKTDDDITLDLDKINKLNDQYFDRDYYGLETQIIDEYSCYHFDKCENEVLNTLPMKTPRTKYCAGGGYYINFRNIKHILSNYKIFSTLIYEDVSVGYSLSINGIKPFHIDMKKNGFEW